MPEGRQRDLGERGVPGLRGLNGRPESITVIGVAGDLAKDAQRALDGADLVVGGRRHLQAFAVDGARAAVIEGDVGTALDAIAGCSGRVCVLASGDPGFFGVVRPLAERFGAHTLAVHPAPSAVSLAFARLGIPWDDAVVVSAHGRPLGAAAASVLAHPKAAVLTSPSAPPQALGAALLAAGAEKRQVAVCAQLGTADERVDLVDLEGLASGSWDPLSVVVVVEGGGVARDKTLAWGLPDEAFAHRRGMVTKAEVRAVALGKLGVPARGVLWDIGAGSGSVAIECARLAPALQVTALERNGDDVDRLRANVAAHGVVVDVVHGEAPAALAQLPDPDLAFVGGGGLDVLDAVLGRVRAGGTVVATYAALDRAAAAYERLGTMVEIAVNRADPLPDGGVRLQAENPVFVVWGPSGQSAKGRASGER